MPKHLNGQPQAAIEAKVVRALEPRSASGGDEMRAVPIIGRGVSGAIPGTQPEQAALGRERRRGRRGE